MEPSVTDMESQVRNVRSLARKTLGSTRASLPASEPVSSSPSQQPRTDGILHRTPHPTPALPHREVHPQLLGPPSTVLSVPCLEFVSFLKKNGRPK